MANWVSFGSSTLVKVTDPQKFHELINQCYGSAVIGEDDTLGFAYSDNGMFSAAGPYYLAETEEEYTHCILPDLPELIVPGQQMIFLNTNFYKRVHKSVDLSIITSEGITRHELSDYTIKDWAHDLGHIRDEFFLSNEEKITRNQKQLEEYQKELKEIENSKKYWEEHEQKKAARKSNPLPPEQINLIIEAVKKAAAKVILTDNEMKDIIQERYFETGQELESMLSNIESNKKEREVINIESRSDLINILNFNDLPF